MDVLTVLKQHSRPVYTIASNRSVDDAIKLMTVCKAEALIVTDDELPVGIFTEKDVFRYYQQAKNFPPLNIRLADIITGRLMTVASTDKITAAIDLMIKSEILHLPVIESEKIIGVLTLKDVVGCQIDLLTAEIQTLQEYIDDLHQAAQD